MRFLLAFLILVGAAATLTAVRAFAVSAGVTLGALPTMLLVAPWFYLLHWVWTKPKRRRAELIVQLRAMIDDPNAPKDKRAWATDRLTKMEELQRVG